VQSHHITPANPKRKAAPGEGDAARERRAVPAQQQQLSCSQLRRAPITTERQRIGVGRTLVIAQHEPSQGDSDCFWVEELHPVSAGAAAVFVAALVRHLVDLDLR